MKVTTLFKQLCFVALAVILVSSCKRSDDDINLAGLLVNSWSLQKLSIDDGNGALDSTEIKKAFDFNGKEIATLTFSQSGMGNFTPHTYLFSSLFGTGDFTWSADERVQTITVKNSNGDTNTATLIFQDANHIVILETNNYLGYNQGIWNFYTKK